MDTVYRNISKIHKQMEKETPADTTTTRPLAFWRAAIEQIY